jgi:endonuclease YncB( thermonuclease family)
MGAVLPDGWDRWTYDAVAIDAHDGDTVHLRIDLGFGISTSVPCRLLGIQAPEVAGPDVSTAERTAGVAARDHVRRLLFDGAGRGVPLLVETVKDSTEGRGRYLARLYLAPTNGGDAVDVCETLVLAGDACRYDGKGKAPKWLGLNRWRRADGVVIDALGKTVAA